MNDYHKSSSSSRSILLIILVLLLILIIIGVLIFTYFFIMPNTQSQYNRQLQNTVTVTPKPQIYLGVNVHGLDVPDLPGLSAFENDIQKKVAIVMWFQAWGAANKQSFDPTLMDAVRSHGSIPMLTWEPWIRPEPAAV